MNALIQLRNIDFGFADSPAVLRGLDLDLHKGERLALVGDNGAGKTTMFHIIMGLLRSTKGEIRILDKLCSRERDFQAIRGPVGFLFQDSDDQLFCPTVEEELRFGPSNLGHSNSEVDDIVSRVLSQLKLEGYEQRVPYRLSGGEKRMVALGSVLTMSPEVLLLDEPTAGLDESATERLLTALEELDAAMILISHNRTVLKRLCNRAVRLGNGALNPADL